MSETRFRAVGRTLFFVYLAAAALASVPLIIAIWQLQKYRNSSIPGVNCTNDRGAGINDMYGLGVRIATYIQCSLMGLASTFKAPPAAKRALSIGNIWFLIAFTTAVWAMLRDPNTEMLDLYVVIVLGNGLTVLMCDPGLQIDPGIKKFIAWPKNTRLLSTCNWNNTQPQGFFILFETLLMKFCKILVLALWRACTTVFWWKTLSSSAVPQPGCENYGYLFVRATLEPGAPLHTFHKVLNILGWGYWFAQFSILIVTVTRVVRFVMWGKSFLKLRERLPHRNRLRILVDLFIVFPCLQVRSVMQRYSSYIAAS